jgi:hypothetical protein
MLQNRTDIPRGKFKTPYVNSKFIFCFNHYHWYLLWLQQEIDHGFYYNETQINSSGSDYYSLNKESKFMII